MIRPVACASVSLLTGRFMTHQPDVAIGRDVVARWCALAEQRLEYLTELFETGRWRRFHTELAFLENIQEAKAAVEIWRDLSMREASRDISAVDISWLGHRRAGLPRGQTLRDRIDRPRLAEIPDRPLPPITSIATKTDRVSSDDVPSAPAMDDTSELTRDIAAAVAERYPLLRNAL
jgi:uncharacterized repeat protein (TIGR03809 family)